MDRGRPSLTDNTMNATVLGGGPAVAWMPLYVLASSNRRVVALIGDSIAAGVNDSTLDPSGGRGLLGRAMAQSGPHLNYGVPGDRAQWYVGNSVLRRAAIAAAGATHGFLQLGVNDYGAGARTSAQMLADRSTIRGLLPSLQIFDTTLTPACNSTDGFRTATKQTPSGSSSNGNRVTFNNTLRTTVQTGSVGVLDVALYAETSPIVNFTGGIAGTTLTATAPTQGRLDRGTVISGTGVTAGTYITAIQSVAADGSGTFTVSASQTVTAGTAMQGDAAAEPVTPNQIQDGGAWLPTWMTGGDGTHGNSRFNQAIEGPASALLAIRG